MRGESGRGKYEWGRGNYEWGRETNEQMKEKNEWKREKQNGEMNVKNKRNGRIGRKVLGHYQLKKREGNLTVCGPPFGEKETEVKS